MDLWPFAISLLCLAVIGRALVIGSASIDGRSLRRDQEPALYWGIILAAVFMGCFLLYVAFRR